MLDLQVSASKAVPEVAEVVVCDMEAIEKGCIYDGAQCKPEGAA